MSVGAGPYDPCPCGSGEKFKFCCGGKKGGKGKYPAQSTIEQAFQTALEHHRAGRLAEAEHTCRQIVAQQPNHADAFHLLGAIARRTGRSDLAVDLIGLAIALRPNDPQAHNTLGNALKERGRLEDAIAAYRQAIAVEPGFPEAYFNLGNALTGKGELDQAIAAYRQAIAHRPKYPAAHLNLGNALTGKGELDQAIAVYRQAIALRPNYPIAHNNLGNVLVQKGQLDEAIAAYHQAIVLQPTYPDAHSNLGNALTQKGQLDEAIAACRQAIVLKPDFPEACNNLASALKERGQLAEAIAACRQAIALKPNEPEIHHNLGNVLRENGFDEAIAAYRQAIALKFDFPEAHWNLALTLLAQGNFSQGFGEYEWRWKCKDHAAMRRNFPQPLWDGRPLAGASLLLHAEQGFGDCLQFIRYLPLVEERGGKIIIECQGELQRLLQTVPGRHTIVSRGQPLPAFDVQCPLLSLPLVFATTLENIPGQVPYVYPDAQAAGKWRERMAEDANSMKVGLAWAGSQTHRNDRNRSMSLSAFAPLAGLDGVSFYSLQKGEQADQARNPPPGLKLIDWTKDLADFADTAALIANLDLVIAVDTAVSHLAGAMGKAVWALLPFVPDWRWLLERNDSPWYPTMRLFRQPSIGDWDSVMRQVAEALSL